MQTLARTNSLCARSTLISAKYVFLSVREIIYVIRLLDYLRCWADKPWCKSYINLICVVRSDKPTIQVYVIRVHEHVTQNGGIIIWTKALLP